MRESVCLMKMIFYLIGVSLIVSINSIIINTNYGLIEGVTVDGVNKYFSIPYANPPINELRFADPVEPEPFSDTYSATTFVPISCPQPCFAGQCPSLTSEDCLYLNIYSPDNAEYKKTSYTTFIWIHGGSFEIGTSNYILYDATDFVKFIGDIIIVTINFRLGLLGLLYDNIYNTGIDGNFAFKDQQLAIKWIYDNIKYFGGNENNIIIFGESSGANYVGLHLLYNNEYINGGIMQSPSFGLSLRTPTTWYDTIEQFTDIVGCSDKIDDSEQLLDCWRSIDYNLIISAQQNPSLSAKWNIDIASFTPTVETQLLEKQPIFEFQNEDHIDDIPPYIIGINKDEYYLFIDELLKNTYSYNDLVTELTRTFFGDYDITKLVLDYYDITSLSPGITDNYLYDLAEILTKGSFICPTRNILKNAENTDNIYYYEFEVVDIQQNAVSLGQIWPQCITKTCHSIELYYLFLSPFFNELGLLTPNTIEIGHEMQIFWSNWGKTLNPNNIGDETWKQYTNKQKQFLRIQDINEYITDSFKNNDQECQFWDDFIGYAGRHGPNNLNHDSSHSSDSDSSSSDDTETHQSLFQYEMKDLNNATSQYSAHNTDSYKSIYLLIINLWTMLLVLFGLIIALFCYHHKNKLQKQTISPLP